MESEAYIVEVFSTADPVGAPIWRCEVRDPMAGFLVLAAMPNLVYSRAECWRYPAGLGSGTCQWRLEVC